MLFTYANSASSQTIHPGNSSSPKEHSLWYVSFCSHISRPRRKVVLPVMFFFQEGCHHLWLKAISSFDTIPTMARSYVVPIRRPRTFVSRKWGALRGRAHGAGATVYSRLVNGESEVLCHGIFSTGAAFQMFLQCLIVPVSAKWCVCNFLCQFYLSCDFILLYLPPSLL